MDDKKKQSSLPKTEEKKAPQEKNKEKIPHDIYEDDGNTHGVYESEDDYW